MKKQHKMYKKIIVLLFGALLFSTARAQEGYTAQQQKTTSVVIKTNLLYGAAALTPNLGIEFGLGDKSTLEISGGYNPWNWNGEKNNNKKLVHILGHVEYRYWTCQRFNGHFFGVHGLGSYYNIGQHKLDYIFGKGSEKYRHQGYAVGAGVSYGYQWLLSKRLSLEATIGLGAAYLDFDRYECPKCGDLVDSKNKTYFGPTKAGIKLIYVIK